MDQIIAHKFNALRELCERYNVRELYLFGSATRDDFDPATSDLDFLVSFQPDVRVTFQLLDEVEASLSDMFGQKVDLLTLSSIERSANYIRRNAILESMEPVYSAVAPFTPAAASA